MKLRPLFFIHFAQ